MDLTKFIFKTIALFLRITPKLKIYSIQFLIILSVACFVEFIYTLIIVLFMSELFGDKEIIAKFETTLIKYFDVAIHVDAKFIALNL